MIGFGRHLASIRMTRASRLTEQKPFKAIAFFVGFGRLAASYHMVEELPDSFQVNEEETLTPWNNESVIVR